MLLAAAAFAIIELFNVPHLAVGGGVHDEVAHIRAGAGQFEPQVKRDNGQTIGEDLLGSQVIFIVAGLTRQGVSAGDKSTQNRGLESPPNAI